MYRSPIAVIALLVCTGAVAWAGDIVAMPTGNMVPQGRYEVHYIYWDMDSLGPPGGLVREHLNVVEFFAGVTDRLEVDVLSLWPQGLSSVQEINLYYALCPETPLRPSLIVGVTNLTGEDWLPSEQRPAPQYANGDDRPSPFVLGSFNIRVPQQGPPSWRDPLIRLHAAYGINFHQDEFFGGMQILVHPGLGAGIFNYQGQPVYLIACMPTPDIEIHFGWGQGDPLLHIGYHGDF